MRTDAKAKLLETALPLFPAKGYAGVSIREIAAAAGVNSSAISYYFGGKEGLYGAILENLFAPIEAIVTQKKIKTFTAEQLVRDFAVQAVALHKKNPYIMKYMYMEMINPTRFCDTIIKIKLSKVYQYLSQSVQQGINEGSFRSELNVGHAAFSLSALINMFFVVTPIRRRFLPETRDEEAAYVEQAVSIFLQGVRRQSHE